MNIPIRIKEYRTLTPDEVAPNPRNWRTHPQAQRDALRGILADVGIVAPVIAYHSERAGGLMLIDGHERMTVGVPFPAAILDVTDEEADKLLVTFDPITSMAGTDAAKLDDLLRDVTTDSPALAAMLDELAQDAGIVDAAIDDTSPMFVPEQWMIVIECASEQAQAEALESLTEQGYTCRALTS